MHSFDRQLKWQNSEWHSQTSLRKKIAWHCPGSLKVMHVVLFSQNGLFLDHSMLMGIVVNDQYCCTFLQDKMRPALHNEQPELLEHGITLLQDNATPHHNHDVQNLVHCWGWEVLAHPPYSSDLAACGYMWKNIFRVSSLNWKMKPTLLALPLYIVGARMNTEQQLIDYHMDGKSGWTLLVITWIRGHAYKNSGISVEMFSGILLL